MMDIMKVMEYRSMNMDVDKMMVMDGLHVHTFRNGEGVGMFNAEHMAVGITSAYAQQPWIEVVIRAHEYGHYKEFSSVYNSDVSRWNQATTDDELERERVAWRYAKSILEGVGFDAWQVFKKVALHGLRSYYQHYTRNAFLADEFVNSLFAQELVS